MPDPTTPTWRLVPAEPTPQMLEVGAAAVDLHSHSPRGMWAAMIEAAPQELPPVQLPELPKVGPICYAMAADVELYKVPRVGNHIPGVYDVALYSADQMRAYARAAIAADRRAGGR